MIHETIVSTLHVDGSTHLAPMGVEEDHGELILAPFRPSATLDNLLRDRAAVINYCDDVRIFAGCLTGHRDWPTRPATQIRGRVLRQALAHLEVTVERFEDDPRRPQFRCRQVVAESHRPFAGFNRAQGAVIEAAILVSRLHMLSAGKIEREIDYLGIAIAKTAGPRELQAWEWLLDRIRQHRFDQTGAGGTTDG